MDADATSPLFMMHVYYPSQENQTLRRKTCSGAHGSWGQRKDLEGAFQTSLLLSVDAPILNDRHRMHKNKNCSPGEAKHSGEKEPQ